MVVTLTVPLREGRVRRSHCCAGIQNIALQSLVGSSQGCREGKAGASNLKDLQFQRAEVTGAQSQSFPVIQRTKVSILHSV